MKILGAIFGTILTNQPPQPPTGSTNGLYQDWGTVPAHLSGTPKRN